MQLARTHSELAPQLVAGVLAVIVHIGFLGFLIFGINWQNQKPIAVSAEIWASLPEPVAEKPIENQPIPERVQPAPPPKLPPPKIEKPVDTPPPDIKIKSEKEKRKEEAEKKKQEVQRRETQERERKALAELQERSRLREEQEKEAQRLAAEAKVRAAAQATAKAKAMADYLGKIQAKIRGNLVLPPELTGNPEVIFAVQQLPSGEVFTVELKKSSGLKNYDAAVERAIRKSSPLPKPEKPELFERNLELRFRPVE